MQTKHPRQLTTGFTLIELMIVVAIIAVLSAIAVNSYVKYAQRSRRSDAMAALTMDQGILERCYAQTFDYSKVTVTTPGCGTLAATGNLSPQKYYAVALTLPAPASTGASVSAFTLTATPAAGSPQVKDTQCATIVLDSVNGRTAADSGGTPQPACWQQ